MPERTDGIIGVAAMGGGSPEILARIQDYERRGFPAAWLTTGGVMPDALTLFAAAAVTTERILLGTCITPTWPRHPIAAVQQVQATAGLANGRFRFGIGPSHQSNMSNIFGADFKAPLTNLREYLTITRTLLNEGKVDFEGRHYRAKAALAAPMPVPVMAAALRPKSYEVCGEMADGAISWVTPGAYLRDAALPALRRGAERAGRPVPPLVAHVPVCVHEDPAEVLTAVQEQLTNYPRLPFYQLMFAEAGYPEAEATQAWSQGMADAVVFSGPEDRVAERTRELFGWGISEIIFHVVTAGADPTASRERTLRLIGDLAKE
ncbi:MAG: LLM class flavin-dependent oxidoreductase [Dehalococcoidia bacterium]